MKIKDLAAEFPREAVHWRVQGTPYERNGKFYAMALAYIDARDVMDRLDDVCGPENWQDEYEVTATGLIVCKIGINIYNGTSTPNWVWKSDGAGETAVEGKKGGMSDAMKRAAVKWGIGRYLYRLDSPWVQCEVRQKNDKTYWKKWIEEPWDKVKVTTYQAAEEAQNKVQAEGDPNILEMVSKAPTHEALKAHWEGNVAYQDFSWFRQAVNARKNELTQKEAA